MKFMKETQQLQPTRILVLPKAVAVTQNRQNVIVIPSHFPLLRRGLRKLLSQIHFFCFANTKKDEQTAELLIFIAARKQIPWMAVKINYQHDLIPPANVVCRGLLL